VDRLADIDLNLLVALDAIIATCSVGAAAARLGLSKPATSHALARVRSMLGDQVLVRSGKEWILTDRARALRAPLSELLRSTSALLFPERALDLATLDREFRVHTTDHVLSVLGVGIGSALAAEAPNVALRFLPVLPDDVTMLRDDIDLGIGVFPKLPPEFRKQALFADRFCCVARADHPSVRGKLTLKQFTALHHVIVAPRGRPGGSVDSALGELGERRKVMRALPYFLVALQCVAESDCIATISLRLARLHATRFGLQVVKPPLDLPAYTIDQVWHPRVEGDPAHEWFRRAIARIGQAMPEL
jgi:DNA-binding transcriptional LysR family regulator